MSNIAIKKHEGWKRTIIYWTDESRTARKDTTGKTMRMEIYKGSDILETLSEDSGNVVHTPAQGQFNLSATVDQILAWTFQSAKFRIIVDNGDDYPRVIDSGPIRVEE
jgi:hypothetical protein